MYHLLLDRHREGTKHTEWLTGVIASTIANWSQWSPEQAVRPSDFALPMLRAEKPPRKPRLNRKKIERDIRAEFDRYKQRTAGMNNA